MESIYTCTCVTEAWKAKFNFFSSYIYWFARRRYFDCITLSRRLWAAKFFINMIVITIITMVLTIMMIISININIVIVSNSMSVLLKVSSNIRIVVISFITVSTTLIVSKIKITATWHFVALHYYLDVRCVALLCVALFVMHKFCRWKLLIKI